MIAHRLGHALSATGNINGVWETATYKIDSIVTTLLKKSYRMRPDGSYVLPQGPVFGRVAEIWAAGQLGTMKSARDSRISSVYEFVYELLAQYLLTGRVTLKPLTPVAAEDTVKYAGKIEGLLKSGLQSSVGKIFLL